jgi:hypothetical protein
MKYKDIIKESEKYLNISALARLSEMKLQTFKDKLINDDEDIEAVLEPFLLNLRNRINEAARKKYGGKC